MKILLEEPALLLERPVRSVVVSDLHLGFESELWGSGVRIPNSSWRIVERIANLVERERAERLIVVGDVKHRIIGASWREHQTIPRMFKYLRERVGEILILPGNHDGGLREVLEGVAVFLPARGYYVEEEGVGFFHGHVWPSEELIRSRVIVAGHMHPVVAFRGDVGVVRRRVWLLLRGRRELLAERVMGRRPRWARGFVRLLIMPSFNDSVGGKVVNTLDGRGASHGPLLRSGVFNINKAEVIMLDGTNLGRLESLLVDEL